MMGSYLLSYFREYDDYVVDSEERLIYKLTINSFFMFAMQWWDNEMSPPDCPHYREGVYPHWSSIRHSTKGQEAAWHRSDKTW